MAGSGSGMSQFGRLGSDTKHERSPKNLSPVPSPQDVNKSKKPSRLNPCPHIDELKKIGGLKTYTKIHTNLVTCVTRKACKLKTKLNKCYVCRKYDGHTHACMHCIFIGCLKGGHIQEHFFKTGHPIFCDLNHGSTYCYKCCDFFYDKDLQFIAQENERRAEWVMWIPKTTQTPGTLTRYKTVTTSKPHISKNIALTTKNILGLRGLINLGHTCFMNCIIQGMIHTPLLRDYFMTTRIVCLDKHDISRQKPCIVTLVCDLYQEFYNGQKSPMSLHCLLYKIWGNAAHLAGYEQQDAHEFFIAMLDALHLHFSVHSNQGGICSCIVDVIFLGRLESAVTCMVCGHKSITVDPFWDISLDLVTETDDPNEVLTLTDCLNRYTRVEHLGSTGMIWCTNCENNQESTKQLKFKTLPVVLCFHLKRFEHRTSYKKIDNNVSFPEELDLALYTSDHDENETVSADGKLVNVNKDSDYRYSLYAVVNHVGSLDGGHYLAYIRHMRGMWFKCDDHFLTNVSPEEVLSSPGYLLFYHKEVLYYEEQPDIFKNQFN